MNEKNGVERFDRMFKKPRLRSERKVREAARMAALLERVTPPEAVQRHESVEETRRSLEQSHIRVLAGAPEKKAPAILRPAVRRAAVAGALAAILLLALILVVWNTGGERAVVARLQVYTGDVRVVRAQGGLTETAPDGAYIYEGDRVETDDTSVAGLSMSDGSIARMDYSSSLEVAELESTSVEVNLVRGNVYHKVDADTRYTVAYGDIKVVDKGSIFNTLVTGEALTAQVIEGSVEVKLEGTPDGGATPVGANQECVAGRPATGPVLDVKPLDPTVLEKPWFVWNRAIDGMVRSPNPDQPAPSTGPSGPSGPTGPYPSPVPDLPAPVTDTTTTESVVNTSPSTTSPEEPVTTSPAPAPPDTEPLAATLSATYVNGGVVLNWGITGSDFYSIVLARYEGSGDPTQEPQTEYKTFDKSTVTFTDRNVVKGKKYGYRIGLVKNRSVKAYSDWRIVSIPNENVVPAPVPPQNNTVVVPL